VHAVSRTSGASGPDESILWHTVDLLEPGQARQLMSEVQPTHLLHLAWYAEPGKFWTSDQNYRHVAASLELLEAFAGAGGKRMAVAGTCAEYDWRYAFCREDLTPLAPATAYGVCKNALHAMATALARDHGVSLAWGRVFWLYGPHEHPARLVASVVRSLLGGQDARVSAGAHQRPFLHVEDVAAAFVALLCSGVEGPVNIAADQPVRISDIVEAIATQLQATQRIRLGALTTPSDQPPILLADTRRLTQEVGFSPRYDLDSGIAQTIAWWRTQVPAANLSS
jgi:nucleoside-diphosphate-sugar epimerase